MKISANLPFGVDAASAVEKYRQIVDGVIGAVREGRIRRGAAVGERPVLNRAV
jgi:hypothetical protein